MFFVLYILGKIPVTKLIVFSILVQLSYQNGEFATTINVQSS